MSRNGNMGLAIREAIQTILQAWDDGALIHANESAWNENKDKVRQAILIFRRAVAGEVPEAKP